MEYQHQKEYLNYESMSPIAFKLDFSYLTDPSKIMQFVIIMLTFLIC